MPGPRAHTVRGPVAVAELGPTLVHEHVLLDFRCRYHPAPDERELAPQQPAPADRWRLVRRPAGYEMNLVRTDLEEAVAELEPFVAAGGRTIVDLTTLGLGPDPAGLRILAERVGVHLVAGTGVYIGDSAPAWVHDADETELAEHFIDELTTGGAEEVLRGVIGEIGVEQFAPVELRCFDAATTAQIRTGAPLFVHVLSGIRAGDRPAVERLVTRYLDHGGDPAKLVLCHQDGTGDDPLHQDRLLALGVTLAYDTFGFESNLVRPDGFVQLPSDGQRVREVARIVATWGPSQVVLSHDLCYRMMLRSWGGWGWTHLFHNIAPRLEVAGVGPTEMEAILVGNPARLLALG